MVFPLIAAALPMISGVLGSASGIMGALGGAGGIMGMVGKLLPFADGLKGMLDKAMRRDDEYQSRQEASGGAAKKAMDGADDFLSGVSGIAQNAVGGLFGGASSLVSAVSGAMGIFSAL